jgi:hypothetical protein
MNKLKAIIWILVTFPLNLLAGTFIALLTHKWGFNHLIDNARVYWYNGSLCDEEGRVFDAEGTQLYPKQPVSK